MIVYLDLVLLLNFCVDFLLILGTNRLSGFPPGCLRAAMGAGMGTVYALGCLMPGFSFLGSIFWRGVFLGLVGVIAFGMNKSAWKRTGIFLLLSMAMGGIALGIGKSDIPALLLAALGVWVLSQVGFGGSVGGKEYIPVTITEQGKTVSVIALKDTGNSLRDPITGEQVMILGPEAAQRLLNLSAEELNSPLETMVANSGQGLRLIPYSAVGQSAGMLIGKRFADVKIGERGGSALVAFAPEKIGAGQVYQALAGGNI